MEYISIIRDDVDLSKTQRYLRLPHPRTGQPQLYLPYSSSAASSSKRFDGSQEETGCDSILEVVKINGSHRRTWFVGNTGIEAGSILVHYPIDPLFLVIPLILALPSTSNNQFQPLSDILADLPSHPSFSLPAPFSSSTGSSKPISNGEHNSDLAVLLALRGVKMVFKACCEKKVVQSPSSSDKQTYYRPSLQLAIKLLQRKVEHVSSSEEFEKFDHLVRSLGRDGLLGSGAEMEELRRLARTKAACENLGQWLHPSILKQLTSTYDFAPLSTHLSNLNAAAIAASQVTAGSGSGAGAKDAKGTKRKAPGSRGVEALKKVNTNNMAKLTSFFKPKEGAEKDKPAAKKKK